MFLMRFDMRAPGHGPAEHTALYGAALDMAAWADERGCLSIVVSEHHTSPDGYLPSPLLLASAMVARTTTVPIQIGALIAPLYDPVRLAEDMAVLDVMSGGRVSYVLGLGYRDPEFESLGRRKRGRGRRTETLVDTLRRAWTGEPFELEGRTVHVTPKPVTPGGPMLMLGGSSETAVKRAARCGLGLMGQEGDPALATLYHEECERLGVTPGICVVPTGDLATAVFIADDVDQAWNEIGPALLHDAQTYAAWLGETGAASKSVARSVDELRQEAGAYRIFTPEDAIAYARAHGVLVLAPLCGGLPLDAAWRSLHLLESAVLPALTGT